MPNPGDPISWDHKLDPPPDPPEPTCDVCGRTVHRSALIETVDGMACPGCSMSPLMLHRRLCEAETLIESLCMSVNATQHHAGQFEQECREQFVHLNAELQNILYVLKQLPSVAGATNNPLAQDNQPNKTPATSNTIGKAEHD